ncbi:sensor domain-containing diguanylate cyclase [Pseudomonas citronellolis]|uniref:sensor domain-containing diguanylate cyclase n=1 Tax=Pseudomonas citronellolis TaxID=53408 RepID=UPI0023E3896E|nr:sensor domain-containing diguanylate cyclase [Pseudomonas citronellolis]MDF3935929.1 diguanylate cyclase [Pseudomonas citronellolis]
MLQRIDAWLRRSPSLRRSFLLFSGLVVLLVGLTFCLFSYLSYRSSLRAHAASVLAENSELIAENLQHRVQMLNLILQLSQPDPADAAASLDDPALQRRLAERLWRGVSSMPGPRHTLFYGNNRGQLISVSRQGREDAELLLRLDNQEKTLFQLPEGPRGEWSLIGRLASPNDVLQRPWFQAGQRSPQSAWTAPYQSLTGQGRVLARVRGIPGPDGQIQGVLGLEITRDEIDEFARSLRISPRGMAFVVDPDGQMITSNLADEVDAPAALAPFLEALTSRVALASIGEQLMTLQDLRVEGEVYELYAQRLAVGTGERWISVTLAPLGDFSGTLNLQLLMLGSGVALILLVALCMQWLLTGWLTRDLARLAGEVRQLGEGGTSVDFQVQRRDEVGQLGDALRQMHADLNTDPLTGLCSRSGLVRTLERAVSKQRAGGAPFALLFLDLNGFKAINDRFGHDAGDLALIEAAGRLRNAVRQGDLVARLGGDEFVVLLWRVPSAEVVQTAANNLRRALQPPLGSLRVLAGEEDVHVGTAIGTALCPQDGKDVETLLRCADQAMYADKQAGKAGR